MTTIEICSAIKNFDKLAGVSAFSENRIDFLHDTASAILCTTAFCAAELKKYLSETDPEAACVFVNQTSGKNISVTLECVSDESGDGGFSFILSGKNQLVIRSSDRNGLVNRTYEFLRLQGWRWIEPGEKGEFAPARHPVVLPENNQTFQPSFKYRAFYFEFSSQASVDFLMWMARSRMNVFGSFPELRATARKLGMYILSGGHVITSILHPNRIMISGKTLFEEHPDWYGKRKDGNAVSAENAQQTQFCCSNGELMDFIADELITRLNHEWLGTDILEISGFDTWGGTCQCTSCVRYSDSDKYLLFMSALRSRFDNAFKNGKLQKNPMLNTWAYEGTATMDAPSHIPANMAAARDNCVAFVIKRCCRHEMGIQDICPVNAAYAKTICEWGKFGKELTLWAGEYYNVSRYEDLPLLFIKNMTESMKFYYQSGARGITYMHTPIINWSVRGITQCLHAALGWNIHADTESFLREFYHLKYGKYADAVRSAYSEVEEASRDIAEWRSWGASILTCLETFSATGKAENNLYVHLYKNHSEVIRGGKQIAAHYRKAAECIEDVLDKVNADYVQLPFQKLAVNPAEAAKQNESGRILYFLRCDLRLLKYAADVITLMTGCAEAYIAVQQKDNKTVRELYPELEKLAKRMSLYTESVSYREYVPHFETPTALERSQCERVVRMLKMKAHSPEQLRDTVHAVRNLNFTGTESAETDSVCKK